MSAAPRPTPAAQQGLSVSRKLLFSCVTVVLVLAALEGAARLLVRVAPDARWARHSTLVNAVGFPALNDILVEDPAAFWTTRPNVSNKRMQGQVASSSRLDFTVSTDAAGCRKVPERPGATSAVAFLGDSTTFGVGVNDDQTYAALLQQRLGDVQTVNLGVPGYTAYQGRLRLESFPFRIPPRAVVVTFGFNDAAAWDELGDIEHGVQLQSARESWTARSRLLSLLSGLLRRPAGSTPASDAGGAPAARRPRLLDAEFAGEIGGIVSWCRDHQAQPILLVWPQRPQLTLDKVSPKQRILLKIGAADPGVRVVNLIEAFKANGGDRLFADMVHASVEGNRVVADTLEPVLRSALAR